LSSCQKWGEMSTSEQQADAGARWAVAVAQMSGARGRAHMWEKEHLELKESGAWEPPRINWMFWRTSVFMSKEWETLYQSFGDMVRQLALCSGHLH
jgi:hypothetical protein